MKRLSGKTALITGSARGIGYAFAEAYVNEGAKVCIADIDFAQAQTSALGLGDDAISVALDVTKQTSIDAAVQKTVSEFGQIDILVNNAAIFSAAPIVDIERSDFQNLFEVNVSGTLFMIQAVARHMIENKIKGKIINNKCVFIF